ncbi:MAG: hypothetical protein V3V47_03335 [Desulfobacteria bacterium]
MGKTTFSGPVVSEQGFQASPVELSDADATITVESHNGKVIGVPAISSNRTLTLTTPTGAGIAYKFINSGPATEAESLIIQAETTDNSVFFTGSVSFLDSNEAGAGSVSSVFADGDSNELLMIVTPGAFEVNFVSVSTTEWFVWGSVVSVTAPSFTD